MIDWLNFSWLNLKIKLLLNSDSVYSISKTYIIYFYKFRKTFSCPQIKSEFFTGTSTADLSPEDIGIMGAMGDSMAVSFSSILLVLI